MIQDSYDEEIQELRLRAEALICCLVRFESSVHDDDRDELEEAFYNKFFFFLLHNFMELCLESYMEWRCNSIWKNVV